MSSIEKLCVIALAALPLTAGAQDESGCSAAERDPSYVALDDSHPLPLIEFLEDSSLFYNLPHVGPAGESALAFEGRFFPHFYLYNTLNALRRECYDGAKPMVSVAFTFGQQLRMVMDASIPVRPASFLPRLFDFQVFKPYASPVGFWLAGARFTPWAHHSNGQQYCPFDREILDDVLEPGAPKCTPFDVRRPPHERLNRWSGDFSTNALVFGMNLAHIWLDAYAMEGARAGVGVTLESHVSGWFPGAIDEEQAALYGRLRGRVELNGSVYPFSERTYWRGLLRGALSYEKFWGGEAETIPHYRITAETSYVPNGLGGVGLLLRFMQGQDYMNILFARPAIWTFQLGVVWQQSPRVRYGFASEKAPARWPPWSPR
jgi:hypothetical protein